MAQTKEQAHAWYLKNKERRKVLAEKNKEHVASVKHAYYLKNKAKRKASDRAYYLANRERKTAWQREYYKQNPDKVKAIGRTWRVQHPEQVKMNSREYRETHRDYRAVHNAKRRALKAGCRANVFTGKEWGAMKAAYGYRCVYCQKKKPLTQDHVIPLAKGGLHDKANIVPACQSCNSRKNTREAPSYQPVLFL